MIGQIGPSVRAGSTTSLLLNAAGSVAGGLCSGVVLCLIGLLATGLAGTAGDRERAFIVSGVLCAGSAVDMGLRGRPNLGPSRQTPIGWACSLGREGAALAWGFDLGMAVTTRLPFFSLLGVCAFALLSGSTLLSALALGAYGAGRAASTAAVVASSADHGASCTLIGSRSTQIRLLLSGVALTTALAGFWLALA